MKSKIGSLEGSVSRLPVSTQGAFDDAASENPEAVFHISASGVEWFTAPCLLVSLAFGPTCRYAMTCRLAPVSHFQMTDCCGGGGGLGGLFSGQWRQYGRCGPLGTHSAHWICPHRQMFPMAMFRLPRRSSPHSQHSQELAFGAGAASVTHAVWDVLFNFAKYASTPRILYLLWQVCGRGLQCVHHMSSRVRQLSH